MIRGRYGLLTVAVLVVMLSAAAGAGFLLVYPPLQDPSVATRQQLFRWLVLRDLSKEPVDIQQKILSRVTEIEEAGELDSAGDLGAMIQNMEQSHRQMLWHNITLLLQPWLLARVEQYSKLPASQRLDYIDSFLARAAVWNKVGSACSKNLEGGNAGSEVQKEGASVSKLLMEQIKQLSDRAPPDERRQIAAFVAAVEARWFWRQMPSFGLFGKSH